MSSFERQNIGEKLFLNQSTLAHQNQNQMMENDLQQNDIAGFAGV